MKRHKKIGLHSCLVLVVVGSGIGLAGERADAWQQAKPVQTAQVTRGDLKHSFELPATVRGFQTADLYAKVGGFLKDIPVDIGDSVTAGETLATLDVPEMQSELLSRQAQVQQAEAEVAQAEAAIEEARAGLVSQHAVVDEYKTLVAQNRAMLDYEAAELARINTLVDRGAVNRELVDARRFKHDSAQASLDAAEAKVRTAAAELSAREAAVRKAEADRLSAESRVTVAQMELKHAEDMARYAMIKAPFEGVITKRWVDVGAFIQPAGGNSSARPLVQIVDVKTVRVTVKISMSQLASLNVGDRAVLQDIDGLESHTFPGEISRMSAGVDEKSRMMVVEFDLDNSAGHLLPGYFGYAEIFAVDETNALLVPATALVGSSVFVVEGGRAEERSLEILDRSSNQVAIKSGVNQGEQVITNPAGIQAGDSVAAAGSR
ncbi:MAG: efflux RND transporter periplasmic adaptor subunit [Pirellulaceae bacterium]